MNTIPSPPEKAPTNYESSHSIFISILGGAAAGLSVDLGLYPLDTLKTRLQSQFGFWNSGGFKGIYKGIGPTSLGSPISAGLFFGTYEATKKIMPHNGISENWYPIIHMGSASVAEIVSCVVKVPMEVIKQRRQASQQNLSSFKILMLAVKHDGVYGLYRGYGSTVLRDIPFSIIEFPVWEWLKEKWKQTVQRELNSAEVATCGAVAGGIAAAITTPLDVVKTQIMLSDQKNPHIFHSMLTIYQRHGITKLFAGFLPRILMIVLGGGIFFGVYDESCKLVEKHFL